MHQEIKSYGQEEVVRDNIRNKIEDTEKLHVKTEFAVGVNADAAPLAGQTSSSSQIVGIDVDVAAAIADQFGVKVQIVDVGTSPEAALSAGTVDIVCGIEESGTDTSFWKSEAYLNTGVALFGSSAGATVPSVSAGAATPSIAA